MLHDARELHYAAVVIEAEVSVGCYGDAEFMMAISPPQVPDGEAKVGVVPDRAGAPAFFLLTPRPLMHIRAGWQGEGANPSLSGHSTESGPGRARRTWRAALWRAR